MNMKQLKYVLVLADLGSFSRAAESLGISQPSLSQYIRKIEQQIGAELFDRSGNSLQLTDAGNAYIKIGRSILDLEHQLDRELADLAAFRAGTISIGISAHRSVSLMPEIVKEFRKIYPGIVLCIEEHKRNNIVERAQRGEFDLCITTLPVDKNEFYCETVMSDENVIIVPDFISLPCRQISNRKFPAIQISSLSGMEFALLNEDHPMQQAFSSLCNRYKLCIKKTVECTSLNALFEMVKAGIGAAFVPSCIAKPQPGVKVFSIEENTERREIVLIWRKNIYQSRAVLDFIALIKDILSKY